MTWGPFVNNGEFEEWYQGRVGSQMGTVLFAVFVNKTEKTEVEDEGHEGEGRFAGIIGLEHTDSVYATTEIGLVRCVFFYFFIFVFFVIFYCKRFLKGEHGDKN